MKKILLSLLAAGCVATATNAQQADQAAAMKAWNDYMTPGKMHGMMAKSDGMWEVATTTWMDPAAPPTKTKGTVVNKMILGDRYQESTFSGEMFGKPFEGRSILAYDNKKGVFKSLWIDNMGTGMMTLEGKWDEATKSITFTGTAVDPMTGAESAVREVFTYKDAKHEHMEMYQMMNGKEVKMMEIDFTRPSRK